jgi:hypothetical protein
MKPKEDSKPLAITGTAHTEQIPLRDSPTPISGEAHTEQIPLRTTTEVDNSKLLVWDDTATAFGDFVNKEFEQGKVPGATSKNEAHKIMCALYIRRDGTRMDPATVQQLVRNRNDSFKP